MKNLSEAQKARLDEYRRRANAHRIRVEIDEEGTVRCLTEDGKFLLTTSVAKIVGDA